MTSECNAYAFLTLNKKRRHRLFGVYHVHFTKLIETQLQKMCQFNTFMCNFDGECVHLHVLQKQYVAIKLDAVTETYSRLTMETSLTVVTLSVEFAVAVTVVVDVVVDSKVVVVDMVVAVAGTVAAAACIVASD
jgi:hypothetical protein